MMTRVKVETSPNRSPRRRVIFCVCLAAAGLVAAAQGPSYSRSFTTGTMRLDYLHTGGPGGEALAIDQVVRDGPWPGSRTRLLDETNLGDSLFEVADRATGRALYSRGFGSIYGEWITTAEFHT